MLSHINIFCLDHQISVGFTKKGRMHHFSFDTREKDRAYCKRLLRWLAPYQMTCCDIEWEPGWMAKEFSYPPDEADGRSHPANIREIIYALRPFEEV